MPWSKVPGSETEECDDGQTAVVKDGDGEVEGCHDTEGEADDQLAALYASESKDVDLTPPQAMQGAAEMGLEKKEELGLSDCGTGEGETSAEQIASAKIEPGRMRDVAAYLVSHEEDWPDGETPSTITDEQLQDGCGPIQYLLWGGGTDTAYNWALRKANQIASEEGDSEPYDQRDFKDMSDCGCKGMHEEEDEEKMGPDVFMDPMMAQERADEIGCEGIHAHEQDGETVFMPCATHEMFQEMTEGEMEKALSGLERLLKADVSDLNEGDYVEWDSSGGTAYGQIDNIAMQGTVSGSLEPADTEHEASEDNPGVIIELVSRDEDGDVMGEGDTVFHRPGELRPINEEDVPGEKGCTTTTRRRDESAVGSSG
jgi:Protein of unknown function (DUF2945)./Protein of unknown function.